MRSGTTHYKDENNHAVTGPGFDVNTDTGDKTPGTGMESSAVCDFTMYPREFITYKWYRPLIVGVLFSVFFVLLYMIVSSIVSISMRGQMQDIMQSLMGGYDTMDVYTAPSVIMQLGGIACFIPALAIANKIAGKRTFKSYESSRGNGWDYGIFFKCLAVGLVLVALPIVIMYVVSAGADAVNRFTTAGLVCVLILGPMQCIGEEFLFRSLLMQTVGSWFRIPALAIVLPSLAFAAMHPYNLLGVVEIFLSGCFFSIVAWKSRGIEASSALHICNNLTVFIMTGLGYGSITSEVGIGDFIASVSIFLVFTLAILLMSKRGMFDRKKGNDAARYNAKIEAKRAKKAAKKAAGAAAE